MKLVLGENLTISFTCKIFFLKLHCDYVDTMVGTFDVRLYLCLSVISKHEFGFYVQ